jgi:hypothetical protein
MVTILMQFAVPGSIPKLCCEQLVRSTGNCVAPIAVSFAWSAELVQAPAAVPELLAPVVLVLLVPELLLVAPELLLAVVAPELLLVADPAFVVPLPPDPVLTPVLVDPSLPPEPVVAPPGNVTPPEEQAAATTTGARRRKWWTLRMERSFSSTNWASSLSGNQIPCLMSRDSASEAVSARHERGRRSYHVDGRPHGNGFAGRCWRTRIRIS